MSFSTTDITNFNTQGDEAVDALRSYLAQKVQQKFDEGESSFFLTEALTNIDDLYEKGKKVYKLGEKAVDNLKTLKNKITEAPEKLINTVKTESGKVSETLKNEGSKLFNSAVNEANKTGSRFNDTAKSILDQTKSMTNDLTNKISAPIESPESFLKKSYGFSSQYQSPEERALSMRERAFNIDPEIENAWEHITSRGNQIFGDISKIPQKTGEILTNQASQIAESVSKEGQRATETTGKFANEALAATNELKSVATESANVAKEAVLEGAKTVGKTALETAGEVLGAGLDVLNPIADIGMIIGGAIGLKDATKHITNLQSSIPSLQII